MIIQGNKLRLPKAFAEKWFEALLSGKYQQGLEYLKINAWDDEDEDFTECRHCCLGVAAEIIENRPYDIEDCNFIGDDDYDSVAIKEWVDAGYPKELIYEKDEDGYYNKIPGLLSKINDGISLRLLNVTFEEITGKKPIIPSSVSGRIESDTRFISFTFEEIVEFVKANFELYE